MADSIFEELSKERKQLQQSGKLPPWFSTLGWQAFKNKYLYEADTFEEQIDRIVNAVANHVPTEQDKEYLSTRWKECIMKNHAYLATPVLANAGTTRGMSVSCSGNYVGDSIYDFYESLGECAVLSQEGFGTSSYLGGIRERGSVISRGGKANGVNPVYEDYVTMSQKVSQGGQRRGAWAGYIDFSHGDLWETVNHVKNNPEGANLGLNVYDTDVRDLNNGNGDSHNRYQKLLATKMITGKGYFYFPDKVARKQHKLYEELRLRSKASNLCVVPETPILTKTGYIPIAELEGHRIEIWNGEQWSEVEVKKTAEDQQIVRVVTSAGQEVECTKYHKFFIQDTYRSSPRKVSAEELKVGDKLIKFDLPVIEGDDALNKAYQNGFYSGDGCCVKGKAKIYLYHDKRKLESEFDLINRREDINQKRIYGTEEGLKDKFFVPSNNYNIESRIKWLEGFSDADGTIARNGDNESLQLSSVEKEFLKEIQLMLQTLGVSSKVTKGREEGKYLLPRNDGSGTKKEYNCKTVYRLLVSSSGLYKLSQLGFSPKRLSFIDRLPQRCAEQFIKVRAIVDEGRVSDTYCFTEEKRGMGMFAGLLTGQCTEITLHADEDHTYSCVLSGMVCSTYDEWKYTDAVYCMTIFLDCLVSLFLDEAKGVKGLEKTIRGTEKSRALGLGLSGFHSYLQKNLIPFESLEAHMRNNQIFSVLASESNRASKWMAERWGEPEWCKGHGIRNTHTLACAPNVTSSLIFGSESQGITPWYGNAYEEGSAAGSLFRINPEFVEVLKKHDKYNDEVIDDVYHSNGSCQHLDFLSPLEKEVFKTFFEINQEAQLRLCSGRQIQMDKYHQGQAQSINLAFAADEDPAYIAKVHQIAFEDENIKSLYYIRSKAGVLASKGVCVSCES